MAFLKNIAFVRSMVNKETNYLNIWQLRKQNTNGDDNEGIKSYKSMTVKDCYNF
jgi:hypothetical protein